MRQPASKKWEIWGRPHIGGVGCYEEGLGNEEAVNDSNGRKSLKCMGMNVAGIKIVLQFGKNNICI